MCREGAQAPGAGAWSPAPGLSASGLSPGDGGEKRTDVLFFC